MTFNRKRAPGLIAFQSFILAQSMVLTSDAHAYIDPGTGSFMLQMLFAGLLGALFAIKTFWRRIRIFFKNFFRKNGDEDL